MKKILFISLLFANTVFAQTKTPSKNDFKYRFGFKVAPNVSWLKSDDKFLKNNGAALNFSYGLTFDKRLNQTFMFTTGFDVTNINAKMVISRSLLFQYPNSNVKDIVDSGAISKSTTYKDKLKYLEIPLLFSGRTKEIGYLTYFFQAGFTPSFLLSQKAKIASTDSAITFEPTVLLNSKSADEFTSKQDDIALVRMGFALGAGVEYNLQGTTSLIGSIRYNNGLFNIMKDPNKEFEKVKSHYISLNIGIVF